MGDQVCRLNLSPHHNRIQSPTEALYQLSLCFPVICIPFLNTLPEMFKWRTERLPQSLPTMSGKAALDLLALCAFQQWTPYRTPPQGQTGRLCSSAAGALVSSLALHTSATALGNFPVTVMGGLLQCAEVVPDPGSSCSVLKCHCTAQLRCLPSFSSWCPLAQVQQYK